MSSKNLKLKKAMKNRFNIVVILLLSVIVLIASSAQSFAVLKVDITEGNVEPIPIAISGFLDATGTETELAQQIRYIVEQDLKSSGLFRIVNNGVFLENLEIDRVPQHSLWRKIGVNSMTSGQVLTDGDNITVKFRLWDPNLEEQIEGAVFTMTKKAYRRAGHKIADYIYKRITGEGPYFDSRILFVSETGPKEMRKKQLAIMDQDGANYMELTDGNHLVLTPRFDSKLHRAIYMSYRRTVPQVYILDIHTGKQRLIGNFPGMSFSPRFSPDSEYAIMSIANDGTTDIFEIHLQTRQLRKLTHGHGFISTSPSYSSDGKQVVFTSDRGGRAQLYVMNRDGSSQRRISFGDGSYTSPVWSPRGDFIAFTKQKSGQFFIGVMRPDGSGERLLTRSWMDEGPTWSPNGRVIIFSRQEKGAGYRLYSVDITGRNEQVVHTPTDASDPAWSPLLG